MNKKNLIGIGTLTLGLVFSACFALASRKEPVSTNAYSDSDTYTASNDHFVASTNRNNALRDAYSGDDNNGDSSRKENVTIADMDHTSTISWKVSLAKYSYDSFRNLKMGNKGKTIENSADSDFAAIYTATGVGTGHYVSAMYTTSAVSNIQDMMFTWGAQGGQLHESAFGDIFFLYKVSDTWTLIKKYNAGYGTENRGTASTWNHVVANPSIDTLNTAGVLGKTAQIAIAYDSGTDASKNSFVCMHTFMINRVASAKATMHYWDKSGNDLELCTYITDSKANNSVKIRMFAYNLSQLQINGGTQHEVTFEGLNTAANFEYHNAKESNYYDQLAYLAETAGVSVPVSPSSLRITNITRKDNMAIIIAALTLCSIVPVLSLLFVKKRKHN